MTRVLLTGGCGFLGSHVLEHLLKNTAFDVVILDKLSYASAGFDRLRDLATGFGCGLDFDGRVSTIGCDLSQPIPEGVAHEIGDVSFVIHAAAETHVDNSIADPLPFIQSNVLGTHHLLDWCRSLRPGGLRRVFLVSTDEVYGPAAFGADVEGFDEDARFRPANPYAATKAGAEALAIAYANTYKLPVTIVSTMNLVGERQAAEKFVPLVIRSVLEGKEICIHADSTLTVSGTRSYLHCRTFADALLFLIKYEQSSEFPVQLPPLPLKLHVEGEREISNLDLALLIGRCIGKPFDYRLVSFDAGRPGHDLRYHLRDTKMGELGWRRPMLLEDSLKKVVHWYLQHRKWLYMGLKRL